MLIFPLKKEWYERIKNGEKTVEYREIKDYWTNKIYNAIDTYRELKIIKNWGIEFLDDFYCYFQLGYKPETRIKARILKIEETHGMETDLKIDKPVYAIHFKLCQEKKNEALVKSD